MLKKIVCTAVALTRMPRPFQQPIRPYGLAQRSSYNFCSQRSLTPAQIPAQNLKVAEASTTVGEQQISYYKTQGGISILDKVPGVKSQNGHLYVLSFTCTKCNSQSIRSFTKQAYHKGVVVVRCSGCQNNHLVADNLGWFQDTPVNVETMYQGQIKKVHDHVAIVKFLQAAFEDQAGKKEEKTAEKKNSESETKRD